MSTKLILTALSAAFVAAGKVLNDYASKTPADAEAAPAAAKGKPGRPPKQPAADDGLGGGDDLGGNDDLGGADDGLGDEPAAEKAPTIEDVRAALVALKNSGSSTTPVALMTKAIGDASKQPTLPNVPAAKYKALIEAANKHAAAAKK